MNNYGLEKMFSLRGRAAAVSGGGSGIGRRIAFALAAAGADVVLVGRREHLLKEAAAEIDDFAGRTRAKTVAADLSETEDIPRVAARISECFGAPRILVNAAGVNLRSSSEPADSARDITPQSWARTMAVNLAAPFFLSRALAGGMSGGGAIINIGSMQTVRAGLGDAAYTASKGGVGQLTRALARIYGRDGITANALLPGFFPSEMTDVVFADSRLAARLADSTILGRNGALSDLDGAAVFLASPSAAYITGALLPVDGGFLAK
ncbi:MAG: SDR family NAD(P)-dependent oxidoreductase [Gammaproteobacteria bacterium]